MNRQTGFKFGGGLSIPPVTKSIIFLCIFIYGLQSLGDMMGTVPGAYDPITKYFGLNPELIKTGYVWQFATYMFLHGGFFHILFNMFVLWMFGSEVERKWGSKKFIRYYLFTGVFAGVCSFFLSPAMTVGASGAIYGLLLAFALIDPNRIIYFYFVIPMKAKYFVLIIGGIELFSSISGAGVGIAHVAHLGGIVGGIIYIFFSRRISRKKRFDDKVVDLEQFIQKRKTDRTVDEILDKVIKGGVQSLSAQEKKKLIDAGHFFKNYNDQV